MGAPRTAVRSLGQARRAQPRLSNSADALGVPQDQPGDAGSVFLRETLPGRTARWLRPR